MVEGSGKFVKFLMLVINFALLVSKKIFRILEFLKKVLIRFAFELRLLESQ